MFPLALILLTSLTATAADFPERAFKEAEVKIGLLKLGTALAEVGGREETFDAPKAIQECDAINKKLSDQFETLRSARLKAKRESEVNVRGWEERAKESLGLSEFKMMSLENAAAAQHKQWSSIAKATMPCSDEFAMTYVENLADDYNAADEPVFNLCVRLVKALRKSPECGKGLQQPILQNGRLVPISIPAP